LEFPHCYPRSGATPGTMRLLLKRFQPTRPQHYRSPPGPAKAGIPPGRTRGVDGARTAGKRALSRGFMSIGNALPGSAFRLPCVRASSPPAPNGPMHLPEAPRSLRSGAPPNESPQESLRRGPHETPCQRSWSPALRPSSRRSRPGTNGSMR